MLGRGRADLSPFVGRLLCAGLCVSERSARLEAMSKFSPARKSSLKKKKHWSGRVHDSVISRSAEGLFNVVIDGGGDYGQFPCIGDLKQDKINYISGKLHQDEILLEVNGQAVSGLTRQDVCRLIKESPDPLALRTVKTGKPSPKYGVLAIFWSFLVTASERHCACVVLNFVFPIFLCTLGEGNLWFGM